MFSYLSSSGKYWLRAVTITALCSLLFSSLAPVSQAFAASDGDGISMVPDAPAGAGQIVGGDEASQEFFKPWLSESMPWDSNWGAFNSSISERLGGSCSLDEKDQDKWAEFLKEMEGKQKKITGSGVAGKAAQVQFRKDLRQGMKSTPVAKRLLGAPSGSVVSSLGSYTDLMGLAASSPQLAACNKNYGSLGSFLKGYIPNPLNLFKSPGVFIGQLVFFIPATVGAVIFELLAPISFGLALTTPHSERGDSIKQSFDSVNAAGSAPTTNSDQLDAGSASGPASNDLGDLASTGNCPGGAQASKGDVSSNADAQLGFNCSNIKDSSQSVWTQLANSLRSALSALYGIIVIAVALIYLFRRNSQSQYHIKVILPRLFLAVVITMAAPWAIGGMITFSNWMVGALFQSMGGSVPQQLLAALSTLTSGGGMTGNMLVDAGGVGIASMAIPVLLLSLINFTLFYLVFVAVLKQLALIALIILAPVACLAFVFREQGKNLFAFWAKALTAVVALPVVLSAVLAGGIMLMKIFWNPSAGSIGSSDSLDGSQPMSRFIATIILAATLFAMLKVLGSLRKWVTGSRAGMIGKIGSAATQIATPAAALAAGAYGGPAAMAAVSAVGGKISSSAGGAGGSGSKFLPDSSAGTFKAASAAAGGGGGASQIGKLTSGLSKKLAQPGQDRFDAEQSAIAVTSSTAAGKAATGIADTAQQNFAANPAAIGLKNASAAAATAKTDAGTAADNFAANPAAIGLENAKSAVAAANVAANNAAAASAANPGDAGSLAAAQATRATATDARHKLNVATNTAKANPSYAALKANSAATKRLISSANANLVAATDASKADPRYASLKQTAAETKDYAETAVSQAAKSKARTEIALAAKKAASKGSMFSP